MDPQQQLKDHDIITRIDERLNLLPQILEQAKKTNGRVNSLENWKAGIVGGLTLIVLVGLPMLWMLLGDVRTDGDLIKAHIAKDK